ncbi:MAG TPA: sigma-70 family RNA polymerase sigma factor [Vicinamibacterales bacterium]|nr:sigma-70 family RNA polymerase sigma factor [Vicinamibacterales bacterium]
MQQQPSDLTGLLVAWRGGDDAALEPLVARLYPELHRIAAKCMRGERVHHTLQASALVNEAFVRLIDTRRVDWQNRCHFLAMAARVMRRVLVDHARARGYRKRGGGAIRVTLTDSVDVSDEQPHDLLALDDALEALTKFDERKCRVVELRFFAGLTVEETAVALGISGDTVTRDWKLARAWLQREMGHGNPSED